MASEGEFPKTARDIFYPSEANGASGLITTEAAENITKGNAVYISLEDGKAYVSDNATEDDRKFNGIAKNTASSTDTVYVQTSGLVQELTGLTPKNRYYVGNSGALTATKTNTFVGVAVSSTTLFILLDIPREKIFKDITTTDSGFSESIDLNDYDNMQIQGYVGGSAANGSYTCAISLNGTSIVSASGSGNGSVANYDEYKRFNIFIINRQATENKLYVSVNLYTRRNNGGSIVLTSLIDWYAITANDGESTTVAYTNTASGSSASSAGVFRFFATQ